MLQFIEYFLLLGSVLNVLVIIEYHSFTVIVFVIDFYS